MSISLADEFQECRRAATPLILVNSPDYRASIEVMRAVRLNGETEPPCVYWDIVAGHRGLNSAGVKAAAKLGDATDTVSAPSLAIQRAVTGVDGDERNGLPGGTVFFVVMADNEVLNNPLTAQAIANARDAFKLNLRTLVILGRSLTLPSLIAEDVPVHNEPLPDEEAIRATTRVIFKAAKRAASDEDLEKAVRSLRGMTRFAVEEAVARKIRLKGLDWEGLAETQKAVVEASTNRAITFERAKTAFKDIGGQTAIKDFTTRLFSGPRAPRVVIRIDEIEKSIGANVSGPVQDNTGTSQAMLKTLLTSMEDNRWLGLVALGGPGCLHGDTPIHDPVDGTTKTVRCRWLEAKAFHVWSLTDDGGVTVARAEAPYRYGVAKMLRVTLASGQKMTVTPGHRFWDGESYCKASEVLRRLREFGACRLPSISERDLEARMQDARHSTQKVAGCQDGCSGSLHLCDEQLRPCEGGDRSSPPSLAGAPEYNRHWRVGDLAYEQASTPCRAQACRVSARPSRSHCSDQFAPRPAGECAHHGHGERSASLSHCCQQPAQLRQSTCLSRKEQQPWQFVPESTTGCIQRDARETDSYSLDAGAETRCLESSRISWRSRPGSSRLGNQEASGGAGWRDLEAAVAQSQAGHPGACGEMSAGCRISSTGQSMTSQSYTRTQEGEHPCQSPFGSWASEVDCIEPGDVVNIEMVEDDSYFDFHVPVHENYWACGLFHHNTGKTFYTAAVGNTFGCLSLIGDLSATKGSLVGESEQKIRRMMDVLYAVGGENVLVVATCNKLGVMPPELLRRFSLGIFYFPRPTAEEKAAIWKIQAEKHGIDLKQKMPDDADWVGSDIRNCAERAWMLGCSLVEAAQFITIAGRVSAKSISELEVLAESSGFLSSNEYGPYKRCEEEPSTKSRSLRVKA